DSGGKLPGTHHYRGYIDELAVWKRALDPGDIRAHYEKRAALLSGLELKWQGAEADRRAGRFAGLTKLGVENVVFAERHPGRDLVGHYYANFGYSCTDPNYWLHGRDGGRLCKLNVRTGEVTSLLDDPRGAVRDPQVHYDAKKILFSYRKGGGHNYNLYEINVDGTGLRRITSGAWDDVEPAYLPDGGIVFCSTRCKRYIGCWLAPSAILFRCDADGGNIRMLSSGAFTENTPAVLSDGRVLYTRWEYVNRDPVVFHHLWTMNPDGTAQMVYFGNMHPGGVFIDAKPIPGTERVAFIHSPAHGRNEHAGWLATVTDRHGPDATSSMKRVTRGNDFRDPWPLSEDAFLAARGKQIVLVDSRGGVEVLHAGSGMAHEPCPVIKRPRERAVPPRIDATRTTGDVILTDVYFGRNMEGVKRGSIKKLLVLEDLPKPANFHGGGSQPIGHGVTSTLKRILGTVPVEPDGSAYFRVPAMRSVYFAALDANDLSVKQMRSFVTLQPGERASCLGCHEDRTKSPASARRKLRALRRGPSHIEQVRDVPAVIDFPRDVQPVLDRHCAKCHNHEKRKGGVVLAGDRGPVFSHSYYTLLLHWQVKDTTGDPVNGSGRQKGNDKPYTTYSSASPLMKRIDGGHSKVRLTPRERSVIRLWIDTSAQYAGTYAAHGTGQVGGCWGNNKPVRVMADRWPATGPARDAVQRRCVSCHGRMLPKHVTDRIPLSHGDMLSWERPMSRFSRHRVYNLSRPEKSLVLMVPLARASGGYAEGKPVRKQVREDRRRPPKPVVHAVIFADANDPDYVKILAHVRSAKAKLEEIKRFDMPGFRPNEHYVREMKRFGVLPGSFDLAEDPIDCYETDMKYWASFWCRAGVRDRSSGRD
ncbi:MAG: HzsA-related protein, partial [Planctomycetota bacterium]